eukprot:365919-Chlamydomonas_euryale.AAC.2
MDKRVARVRAATCAPVDRQHPRWPMRGCVQPAAASRAGRRAAGARSRCMHVAHTAGRRAAGARSGCMHVAHTAGRRAAGARSGCMHVAHTAACV